MRKCCWLPAFSAFPKMFSRSLFLKVIKSRNCGIGLIVTTSAWVHDEKKEEQQQQQEQEQEVEEEEEGGEEEEQQQQQQQQ